jgi:hypothetical protein
MNLQARAAQWEFDQQTAPFLEQGAIVLMPHNTKPLASTNVYVAPLAKTAKPHSK